MAENITAPSIAIINLYGGDESRAIGHLDSIIISYQSAEKKQRRARNLNIGGSIFSGVLVLVFCVVLHFSKEKNATDEIFIYSIVMIGLIIVCSAFLSRLVGIIAAFTLSVTLGGLFLFLGRGDFSFEAAEKWWIKFTYKKTEVEQTAVQDSLLNSNERTTGKH